MSGQSDEAAERSAHVRRWHTADGGPNIITEGPGPSAQLTVVVRLEAEVARLRQALAEATRPQADAGPDVQPARCDTAEMHALAMMVRYSDGKRAYSLRNGVALALETAAAEIERLTAERDATVREEWAAKRKALELLQRAERAEAVISALCDPWGGMDKVSEEVRQATAAWRATLATTEQSDV